MTNVELDPLIIVNPARDEQTAIIGRVDSPLELVPEVTNPVRPAAAPFRPRRVTATYTRRIDYDGDVVGPWRLTMVQAADLDGGHATWALSMHAHLLPGWLCRFADRVRPADPANVYTEPEDDDA